ncbi:MAG: hypothetical protein ACFFBY_09500, partial [Promethearchaeota archaeon]
MSEEYELLEGEFEVVTEKPSVTKSIISWIVRNFKFLLLPGSTLEDLSQREYIYERSVSRRKFIRRFKSALTITGIVIVFFIITLAVFPHWISTFTVEQANGV